MELLVPHDIQKLINDIEEVRQVLEMLHKDHALWARKEQEKDLSNFATYINQLEADISIILDKLVANSNKGDDGEAHVIKGMQKTFSYMSDLFHDVKKIREDLDRSYIREEELETLEIDWARFKKNVSEALNCMQYECLEKMNLISTIRKTNYSC